MVREINRDPLILARKARPATSADSQIADDLLETLVANEYRCLGMAANMIGESVAIIAFFDGGKPCVMFNPKVVKRELPYTVDEGCLSLDGTKTVTRYKKIRVEYETAAGLKRVKNFAGIVAETVLHELDHLGGILV